jgi:chromosomal replication initiator protein
LALQASNGQARHRVALNEPASSAGGTAADADHSAHGLAGAALQQLARPTPARPPVPAATTHRLNTALTFDTLVAGRANQMARTAALHVAGAPGVMYNPLFIYGGVGLGKTHLVHAVGNSLLKDNPTARVLYLHAEQFISDVVKNYQRKTFDELKAKYHSLDLLLIGTTAATRSASDGSVAVRSAVEGREGVPRATRGACDGCSVRIR